MVDKSTLKQLDPLFAKSKFTAEQKKEFIDQLAQQVKMDSHDLAL